MSWYSNRWRSRNANAATPLPTVAPTSPLTSANGGSALPSGVNVAGPQAGFAHLLPQTNTSDPTGATRADRKTLEPLFGPNIGAVSSGPAWTGYVDRDKKVLGGGYTGLSSSDELTPEVINGWVEKSKDPTQPTTTLQALVNLKRPSLRLVPLTAPSYASDTSNTSLPPQQHALEFTYDADAPKVSIRVHVYLPRGHPDLSIGGTFSSPAALTASPNSPLSGGVGAPSNFASPVATTSPSAGSGSSHPYAKLLVFESVAEGGFGRKLKIGDGAVVELGRFEKVPHSAKRGTEPQSLSAAEEEKHQQRGYDNFVRTVAATGELPDDALPRSPQEAGGGRNANTNANATGRRSRRITRAFRLITPHRHRDQDQDLTAAGPALVVVDAQPEDAAPVVANPVAAPAKKEEEHGVKLTIRLVALDEQGAEMGCPNEQVTYLHVVRVGATATSSAQAPAVAGATTANSPAETTEGATDAGPETFGQGPKPEEETEEEEDTRPWVVKVVKREATIGPHTFHLHEIFGLTNSASDAAEPAPAPVPVQGHTYPPTGTTIGNDTPDDPSPSEECLLCLSSPREVVLLPCRHLVACKDCALNMVEFGAGGAINQGSEMQATPALTAPIGGAAEGQLEGTAAPEGGASGVATNIVNAMNTRRKRKAKGWFCPVCRQPYTSLLRLTTQAPPPGAVANSIPTTTGAAVEGAQAATNGDEANAEGSGNGGILGSLRPSFFRSLTSGKGINGDAANTGGSANVAGGINPAAAGGSAAGRGSGVAEEEGDEMVQMNARAGDVESTGGLGRPGA